MIIEGEDSDVGTEDFIVMVKKLNKNLYMKLCVGLDLYRQCLGRPGRG